MKIRTRLYLAFLLIAGVGFYLLTDWAVDDLRLRYQAAMEESMVDTATLLAALLEREMQDDRIDPADLRSMFQTAREKRFAAEIFEYSKTNMNMRVYVTDAKGVVLYDSEDSTQVGRDYSRWNDVYLTLRGQYGARATRRDPEEPMTAILHVAAPIVANGRIAGVVSVAKPADSIAHFLRAAQRNIAFAGLIAAFCVALLGVAVFFWITAPIDRLIRYARAVRDGRSVAPPRLGRNEIGALGEAFEQMRVALEGKQYVEEYVQTLTHQMKSPLSAIRGAAELLDEEMPLDERRQFIGNLKSESARIQDLIDRMLLLAALENRRELRDAEAVNLEEIVLEVVESMRPAISVRGVAVAVDTQPAVVQGERFLLRQAVANLLQNALEFSPENAEVSLLLRVEAAHVNLSIRDQGPGIPPYALDHVFERFYSLPRPGTGKKSSGLGLAVVRQIVELHGGTIALLNTSPAGVRAMLTLPLAP